MKARQTSLLEDHIEAEFRAFNRAHPEVYTALVELARQWKAAGHAQGSIALLFEVLRWETGLGARDAEFQLNNNLRSRYARHIMMMEPDLDGFFQVRVLATDRGEVDG